MLWIISEITPFHSDLNPHLTLIFTVSPTQVFTQIDIDGTVNATTLIDSLFSDEMNELNITLTCSTEDSSHRSDNARRRPGSGVGSGRGGRQLASPQLANPQLASPQLVSPQSEVGRRLDSAPAICQRANLPSELQRLCETHKYDVIEYIIEQAQHAEHARAHTNAAPLIAAGGQRTVHRSMILML